MRVKVKQLATSGGLHPSEVAVEVITVNGPEGVIIDRRSIEEDSIDVGYPVGRNKDHLLVELPSETMRGAWRVWIEKSQIVEEALKGVA